MMSASSAIERRLGRAAASSVLMAALALAAGFFGLVLVWGALVVPGWAVSAVLLGISLALVGARALLRTRRARHAGAQEPASPRSARRTAAWAAGAAVVALVSGLGFVADRPATYTVLGAAAPGSCQVAVRESSFLFAGAGEVYAVGAGGLGRAVGSWTADDGYQPVASGTYELEWEDGSAVLSLHSSAGNPVWPASHTFACP